MEWLQTYVPISLAQSSPEQQKAAAIEPPMEPLILRPKLEKMFADLALKAIKILFNLMMEMLNLIQKGCLICSQESLGEGNENVSLLN